MAIKIDFRLLDELVSIQKERKLAMDALSLSLGVDISFSDDEVLKFAQEAYQKHIDAEINKEVEAWMKSLYS